MDHEQDFDPKNKNYDEMELEDSSIDSNETIDSNNKTKMGILQVSKDQKSYLPKVRKRLDFSVVPIESIMREQRAPNKRLEPTNSKLSQDLRGRDNEAQLFELLEILGMSMLDSDGTAVNKKERLVPETLLRSHINSALRYL